jgi:hypothetical protein
MEVIGDHGVLITSTGKVPYAVLVTYVGLSYCVLWQYNCTMVAMG